MQLTKETNRIFTKRGGCYSSRRVPGDFIPAPAANVDRSARRTW